MQYKDRKLALSFIVTILKTTTVHNRAHFPSFKTVPELPISHFSLVAWKIHLCKCSVCWMSVIISEPSCQLQLDYLDTMSKSPQFLPSLMKTDNCLEEGRPDLWEQSQESWEFSCFCVPTSPSVRGHALPKPTISMTPPPVTQHNHMLAVVRAIYPTQVVRNAGGRRRSFPGRCEGHTGGPYQVGI